MANITDLLSAASLLLAVIAVLYSVWYSEIDNELRKDPQPLPAMNKDDYEEMAGVLNKRAIPLATASTVIAAIFIPDAIKLAIPVIDRVTDGELPRDYNAVSTSYFVATTATTLLAVHLLLRTSALWRQRKRFKPTP